MRSEAKGARADLVRAFRAGQRSGRTAADSDVALARWSERNCRHGLAVTCAAEHAWWDGFADPHDPLPAYLARGIPNSAEFSMNEDGVWEPVRAD